MAHEFEQCIGVLGGGQLGRMLALEARRMGYQVLQWTGGDTSGAARFSDHILTENFDDPQALERFLDLADVATVEFENIPKELINTIAQHMPIMPSSHAVAICQHRELEKTFLADNGIPTAAFRIVNNAEDLANALQEIPGDVILKTVQFGYDGKGQLLVPTDQRPPAADIWKAFGNERAIVEQRINLAAEISVMVVRAQDGTTIAYDPAENEHRHHILHLSIVPARISPVLLEQAKETAIKVAKELDYVGVLGVEFFIDQDNNLLVNEMAPRPHNSGHHTLDACETSQFEQLARVVNKLPLGGTALLKPVVLWNLLGDHWINPTTAPDWSPILNTPGAKLHLYGKSEAKPLRKMGHVTFTGDTIEQALERAQHCIDIFDQKLQSH